VNLILLCAFQVDIVLNIMFFLYKTNFYDECD